MLSINDMIVRMGRKFLTSPTTLTKLVNPAIKRRRVHIALLAIAALSALALHNRGRPWIKFVRDTLLHRFCFHHKRKPSQQRQIYSDAVFPKGNTDRHHSHGRAASLRTSFTCYAKVLALQMGRRLYDFQGSPRTGAESSSRIAYGAKDLSFAPRNDRVGADDLIVMVDVDYYCDMNLFLSTHFNPTLLYTFSPIKVADTNSDNMTYTFDSNNVLHCFVNGGARYDHELWDYSVDHVLVGDNFGSTLFLVDRRRLSPLFMSVLFTPVKRWTFPMTILLPKIQALNRLTVCNDGFISLKHLGSESTISIGKCGHFASTDLPVSEFEGLSALARTSGTKPTLSSLKSFRDRELDAAFLLEYLRVLPALTGVTIPSAMAVKHFSFSPLQSEGKPSMMSFMSPFVDQAHCPIRDKATEEEMVKGRIKDVKPPLINATNILLQEMAEFVGFLKADLVPTSYEEVFDRQNRPSQRRILESASVMGRMSKPMVSVFTKAEAYGEVKDPRPISQVEKTLKMEYSRYMYALADHLKTFKWYAFGHSPKVLAERVATLCQNALKFIILTDFSRMDGRVSNVARILEAMILSACFSADVISELLELHRKTYNTTAYTTNGVSYATLFARLSGSPETSVFNTIWNKFVSYITARCMRMSPKDAFNLPGLYGGDDGITAELNVKTYSRMAKAVGQKLTASVIRRGDRGVEFLARRYSPQVWDGSADSCCDIPRQLGKFHVTTISDCPPLVKLKEKALSYILTDANTPIIGAYCAKVIELTPRISAGLSRDKYWTWECPNLKDQFPNGNYLDWMNDEVECYDVSLFTRWLDGVTEAEQLLRPPLLIEPTPDHVLVDRREKTE